MRETDCRAAPVESAKLRVAKRYVGCCGDALREMKQVALTARVEQLFDTTLNAEGVSPLNTGAFRVSGTEPVLAMFITEADDVCPRINLPKSIELGVAEKCMPVVIPVPMTP